MGGGMSSGLSRSSIRESGLIGVSSKEATLLRNASFKDNIGGVKEKFSSLQNRGPDHNIVLDEMTTKAQFDALVLAQRCAILPKKDIMELLNWTLRLHHDPKRKSTIVRLFTSYIDDEDGLTFEEFHSMYEEIATRVELEAFFLIKYAELNDANAECLSRENITILTDCILIEFAPIWCTKREIIEMKKKLKRVLVGFEEERLKQDELFEVYDGMLVTIRLINRTRAKYTELKKTDEPLGKEEIDKLSEWIFRSFLQSGIAVSNTNRDDMRKDILSRLDEENSRGVLSLAELAQIFEGIMERKRWYYAMNAIVLPAKVTKERRIRNYNPQATYILIKAYNLDSVGITPAVRDMFVTLHSPGTTDIGLPEAITLLNWMFHDEPDLGQELIEEFKTVWSSLLVNFDAFCSILDAARLNIEMKHKLEKAIEHISPGFVDDVGCLETVIEEVLYSAENLGCSELERASIKKRLVASVSVEHRWTPEDSSDLVVSLTFITLAMKASSKKFRELDADNSGLLEGEEIDKMVSWALETISSDPLRPSANKIREAKVTMMGRLDTDSDGKLSLGEFAVFYDVLMESMESKRKTAKYRKKVEGIILNMFNNENNATVKEDEEEETAFELCQI